MKIFCALLMIVGKIHNLIIKLFLTIAVTIILGNGNSVFAYDVPDPNQPSCSALRINGQANAIVAKGVSMSLGVYNIRNANKARYGMVPENNPRCALSPLSFFSGSADGVPDFVDFGCLTDAGPPYCQNPDFMPADLAAWGSNTNWGKTVTIPPGIDEDIYTVFVNPAANFCFPSASCGSNFAQRTDNPYSWIYTSNPAADLPANPTWCRGGTELQCNGDTCDIGAAAANLDLISNQNTSGGDCTATLCLVDCSLPQNCGIQTRAACGAATVDCGPCPTNTPVPTTPPTPTLTPTPTLAPLQDLVITNLSQTSPGQCIYWDDNFPIPQFRYYYTQFNYTATIRNQGSPAISTPFVNKVQAVPQTVLVVDNTEDFFTQNSLGGGSQFIRNGQIAFYTVGSPTYDGTIDASTDINNVIVEGNESNNTWSNNYTRPRFICCPTGYTYNPVTQTCLLPFVTITPVVGTPTPLPTAPPSSWVFPVQVLDAADKSAGTGATPVLNVRMELLYSDSPWVNPLVCPWTDPNCGPPLASFTPLSGLGSYCLSQPDSPSAFIDPGFCQLYSTVYHRWFLIKYSDLNTTTSPDSTLCTFNHTNRPFDPDINSACAIMSTTTIRRGFYGGAGNRNGNVMYVNPPVPTATPTITPTPTPTTPAGWFQVQGGNALAKDLLRSPVPAGIQFNTPITQASQGVSYWGADFYAGLAPGKNAQSVSSPELSDYLILLRRFDTLVTNPRYHQDSSKSSITPVDIVNTGSLGATQIYDFTPPTGTLTVNGDWSADPFDGNSVIFVNGNLRIDSRILIENGGFLGFVVSGDITIADNIGGLATVTTPHIEGFYFSDGVFNAGTSAANPRINFSGTFAANSFNLNGRDLGIDNQTNPAVTFTFRPDFQLSAPQELRRPYRFWQELNP